MAKPIPKNTMLTSHCLLCKYGSLTKDKRVYCSKTDKTMIYGKRIVCEDVDEKTK